MVAVRDENASTSDVPRHARIWWTFASARTPRGAVIRPCGGPSTRGLFRARLDWQATAALAPMRRLDKSPTLSCYTLTARRSLDGA